MKFPTKLRNIFQVIAKSLVASFFWNSVYVCVISPFYIYATCFAAMMWGKNGDFDVAFFVS